MSHKVFLSTPISSFDTDAEYKQFRSWLIELLSHIRGLKNVDSVFCVAGKVGSISSLDDPEESLKGDIQELDESTVFILLYPKKICTSALIELGYAVAKNIEVLIVSPSRNELPFMASKMDKVYSRVKFSKSVIVSHETKRILVEYISELES